MNKLNSFKNTRLGPLSIGQLLFWGIVLIFALIGFFFIRGIVSCWTITSLPGTVPANCGTVTAGNDGPILNIEGTPVATSEVLPPASVSIPESDLPPAWDGASRVNVLLIGLDYRDWEAGLGAPRSDTMIVLTIDPLAKTAGIYPFRVICG
jgi:polyisoprenyl-teichoic acid--peptidoglycan teichoic acid transferase